MDVNFDIYSYKIQEKAFMSFLYRVKNADKIRNVLELGAGTGRVTKIVSEALSYCIERYDVVDIDLRTLEKTNIHLGKFYGRVSNWMNLDAASSRFDKTFFKYDPCCKYELS